MKSNKICNLEKNLKRLLEKSEMNPMLTVREIIEDLSGKGQYIILVFLSLFFCQPLQIPGLLIPLGLLIAFLGLRLVFRRKMWLPQRILSKPISSKKIQKIATKALVIIKKTRGYIYPRAEWICELKVTRVVNGFLIFFLGLFLAMPIPVPFHHLAPGWTLLFLTIGLLEEDGVFVLIGYLGSILCLIFLLFILLSIEKYL